MRTLTKLLKTSAFKALFVLCCCFYSLHLEAENYIDYASYQYPGVTCSIPYKKDVFGATYTGYSGSNHHNDASYSFTFNGTVTMIGDSAFWNRYYIDKIWIPLCAKSIGKSAFQDMYDYESIWHYRYIGLSFVNLGAVETIGDKAFYGNHDLTSITIPASVTRIDHLAFDPRYITSLTIDPDNAYYDNRDGSNAIIETFTNTLKIGFSNSSIPKSVVEVGDSAFYLCPKGSITIPTSVKRIGNYAFYSNGLSSAPLQNGLKEIGAHAFEKNSLTEVSLPQSVTTMGDYAFANNTKLNTFSVETALLTKINEGALKGCTTLININIPSTVTSFENSAFQGCTSLTTYTIPAGVHSIGDYAFADCSKLNSVTIPSNVEIIGYQAFEGTPWYTSVKNSSTTKYGNIQYINNIAHTAINTEITECQFRTQTVSISPKAFWNCSDLTAVSIPAATKYVGEQAFERCTALSSITVASNNPYLDSRENCNAIIDTESNTLLVGCQTSFIPSDVTGIANYAFSYCAGLPAINIPTKVKTIGVGAFQYCSSLSELTIPNSVETIGDYAFQYCTALATIHVGKTPAIIEAHTFDKVNKKRCILYVPTGYIEAYQKADYWAEFENIQEYEGDSDPGYDPEEGGEDGGDEDPSTDISTFSNVIYSEPVTGFAGSSINLPILMNNTDLISGIEFNLRLPKGVSIPQDEDGYYLIDLGLDRTTERNHVVEATKKSDGTIYVLCYSSKSKTFSGNEGVVLNIPLEIGTEVKGGNYTLEFSNIVLTKSTSKTIEINEIKVAFSIYEYIRGDANNDGKINGGDIVAVANYLLDYPNDSFHIKAADANMDGKVNGGDIVAIANYLLYDSFSGQAMESRRRQAYFVEEE